MEEKVNLSQKLSELFDRTNLKTDENMNMLKSVKSLEDERNALKEMVRNIPNDMDLGKQIRSTYRNNYES
jgi:hypothetical protein